MNEIYRRKITAALLFSVPLTAVFAQWKLTILGIPWYIPEILTLMAFVNLIFFEKIRMEDPLKKNAFFIAGLLIFFGCILSIASNDVSLHGYGRLKSWFFFPVLYGVILSFSLKRRFLSGEDVLRALFLGGILIGTATLFSILAGDAFSYDHRLHGSFPSPNHLAMLLGTAILTGGFLSGVSWMNQGRGFAVNLFGTLFLITLLILTQSYAVIFSVMLILGIGIFGYRVQLSRRQVLLFFFGLMLSVGFLLMLSPDKWRSFLVFDERSSLASRNMIWHAALRMIGDNPVTGIGPGNFQEQYLAYQRYFQPYLEWAVPHPHNMFLDMWLEGGLFGFLGLGMLFLFWIVFSARNFWQKKNESIRVALPFLFASYFFLIGMTDVPFLRNDLAYFFVTAFVWSALRSADAFTGESDRSFHHDD